MIPFFRRSALGASVGLLLLGLPLAAQAAADLPSLPGAPAPDAAARAAAAAAAAAKANIEVAEGWTRATPGNATTAAVYLRITSVKDPDRVIGAKAAAAERAEIHTTTTQNGTTRMAAVPAVAVPGGGTVTFAPTGAHIMLTGLKAPLRQGDSFLVQLEFEKAGTHTAVVRIGAANATAAPPPRTAGRDMTSGASQPAAPGR
jgi:copper(I)-binding protein